MKKLLIGGSPCTHWSIARTEGRETAACGIGWELFRNFAIAKERFSPDFFLYENNQSAAQEIKEQISAYLCAPLVNINSSLLSAQNRPRFYACNFDVQIPQDKGLVLRDIILPACEVPRKYWIDKPYIFHGHEKNVCATLDIKAMDIVKRVYSTHGKSPTLTCDGGGGHRQKKIYQDGRCRKLTPVEYERLQTMPDNYTSAVSDSRRYSAIGNGWTASVIIHLLQCALKDVDRGEKLVVVSMYDGIGTGRYCIDKLGFKDVEYYAFEIDEYASKIANANYPDIIQCGDAFQMRDDDFDLFGNLEKSRNGNGVVQDGTCVNNRE